VPTAESPVDLQRLAADCVAAAGGAVDWSRTIGLNLVFNADLDRPRGGEVCLEVNGGSKCYRATWLWPGWYHNQAIWAHEMGHTFGLKHSSVGSGNGYGNGYGNMWDVMSVDGPCRTEPPYGRIGQHPIAYQKDILGWIPAERIFGAKPDSQATITLEQTAAPATRGYLLAQIPIGDLSVGAGRHYYTVEARRRTGYDASLPGDGVIIHEVDLDGDLPVRPVNTAPGGNVFRGATTGSAARWTPGQIFRDALKEIAVSVDRATPTGFVVTIFTHPLPAVLASREGQPVGAKDIPDAAQMLRQGGAQVSLTAVAFQDEGIYAVWTEHADPLTSLMEGATASPNLYFAHRPLGGAWSEREQINDDSRDSRSNPAIAADRQGNAYAAWVDYRNGAAVIYIAKRPAGGVWGKNVKLSDGSAKGYSGPAIIVDWKDEIHVLWEGLDRCSADEAIIDGGE